MRRRIKCRPAAALIAVLAVLSTLDHPGPASAQGKAVDAGDSIQAEVKGEFSKAVGAGGEHAGFQIRANGVTWEVDASANTTLLQMAEQLDGKLAVATGAYAERRVVSRVRRILTAQALEAGAESGRREYVDVTVRGTLRTGVIAIGAETTGVTITAGTVTWELELDGSLREVASKLSGSKAIVSGQLRHQGGVEVRNRSIVRVRAIESR